MKIKVIGLTVVVLITASIIGYKTMLTTNAQAADKSATPRVLLVANLGEADEEGDSCALIIHLVREAHDRGVAVQEMDSRNKSPLIKKYHVLVIPTVLIFDANGKETARLQGEGADVIKKLRTELAHLK